MNSMYTKQMIDSICAVVLCKNESIHIRRCIDSLLSLTSKILVVDSYSTDSTLQLLSSLPCTVAQHPFISHSDQFNWALDNLPWDDTPWVIRVDADEFLSDNFVSSLLSSGYLDSPNVHAISIKRSIVVDGSVVRFGGLSPSCIRIVRTHIRYPNELMDEHFIVSDSLVSYLAVYIYDYSLKPFSWWIEKHFLYSKKEAIQYLATLPTWRRAHPKLTSLSKRYTQQHLLYYRFPLFFRAFLFFLFRFFFLLGFVNRPSSCRFIFFQCLVYRFLVDFWISIYTFDKFLGDFRSFESDLSEFSHF